MLCVSDTATLRETLSGWREQGEKIALVPTMGNLHAGHLHLTEQAKALSSRVVVSIFVNPMQFDRDDDLRAYPRTLEEDTQKLQGLGTDLLFVPGVTEMYPLGTRDTTYVEVPGLSEVLCGASRPGHFRGVATVVTKLFNLVQPEVAVFGEKDYQQLLLIRRLVGDLNFPIEIVGMATVREADGLAMSSRNRYLDAKQRAKAPFLYKTLQALAEAIRGGDRNFAGLADQARKSLAQHGLVPDYLSVRRQSDLAEALPVDRKLVILAAAWLGKARLIDNLTISLKDL